MSSHGLRCLRPAPQTSESSWKHAGMPMKHAGNHQLTAHHDGRLVQAILSNVAGAVAGCPATAALADDVDSGMLIMLAQHVPGSVQLFVQAHVSLHPLCSSIPVCRIPEPMATNAPAAASVQASMTNFASASAAAGGRL